MTADEVKQLIEDQVAGRSTGTQAHGVDLRLCLVSPTLIQVISRAVDNGKIQDAVEQVWLVLEEKPLERDGYKIVFDEKMGMFGLASKGFTHDAHPVLCGLYGDFMTTLDAM
jgi:hypothetical protein